jgi:hypothetical protein
VLGGCCRECCVGHWCREKTPYDACIATPGVGPQSPKPQCAGTNRRVLVYSPVMLSSIMQRVVLQDCPVVGGAGGAPLNVLMCALLSCKYVHNAAALAARTARALQLSLWCLLKCPLGHIARASKVCSVKIQFACSAPTVAAAWVAPG